MEVRILGIDEIPLAVLTATEIYTTCDMQYAESVEEIEQFRRNMNEENLRQKVFAGSLVLWGAFERGRLCAVAIMESGGTIQAMYIRPEYRNGSCESQLIMAMHGSADYIGECQKKNNGIMKSFLIIFVIAFVAIVGAVIAILVMVTNSTENITKVIPEVEIEVEEDSLFGEAPREVAEFPHTAEREGATGEIGVLPYNLGVEIVASEDDIYVAEDVEYEISAEVIELFEDTDEQRIRFDVNYPQITYKDGRDASAVNQILRDCACIWYDKMYPKPQYDSLIYEDGTERLYLVTEVEYQITYMSNDLICVVFCDQYYPGTEFYEAYDLRTRVIDLKTGEEYLLEEVITADEALGQLYYNKLCAVDELYGELPNLTEEIVQETLYGDIVEGRYYSNLIVSNAGVGFGFTMHYGDGRYIVRGWEDVEFSDGELDGYRTDSRFWEIVD